MNLAILRCPRIFSSVLFLMILFLVPSVASVNFIIAQGQTGDGQFPQSIIVSSSTDTTPHLLKLKATQQGGTETRVSGFSLDNRSAVGAQANSQLLVLVTDSSLRVTEAKVRTASNQFINLIPVTSQQAGAFSLANLPGGVYTLDVITQKGNAKAAYEGILSIGQQPLTVIEETTKRVTNEYGDLYIIFLPPDECPPGTTGIPPDCEPICDVDDPPPECVEPIVCPDGSTVPQGEDCPEPPICTPDGPPCPPCPEGVEAGWCADEDERQDFDCDDPGMEDDPRCQDEDPIMDEGAEEATGEEKEEEEESEEEEITEEEDDKEVVEEEETIGDEAES